MYVAQNSLTGLASAIDEGLSECLADGFIQPTDSLLVILGDTIIGDSLERVLTKHKTFVGWHAVEDYKRWCLITTDECDCYVDKFVDKPDTDPGTRKAVIGIYGFSEIQKIKTCLEYVIDNNIKIRGEFQLSSAMELYMERHSSIVAVEFREWYDCGDLGSYSNSRKNLTRNFNSLKITDYNTIIKTSKTNNKKIASEANWYLNLPNRLRIYTPQLIDCDLMSSEVFYELEYVNFSPLHELYIYQMPELSDWEKIIENVMLMIKRFKAQSIKVSPFSVQGLLEDFYKRKTHSRVSSIEDDEFLSDMLCTDKSVIINGVQYKSINELDMFAENYYLDEVVGADNVAQYWQIIHGDLFFGNMLYDINTNTMKIIDPRGNFGFDTIYGDVRYDIAKLYHSIYGQYDFIVNGIYSYYEQSPTNIEFNIYNNPDKHMKLLNMFEDAIVKAGFNLRHIKILTANMFLTMIPLHSENPIRQKTFLAIATKMYNELANES